MALPSVMGVLNVTPDSFSDGGRFLDPGRAVEHARDLAEQGADVLDVGGESTRPGAAPVDEEEELRRVVPVVRRIVAEVGLPVSVDTRKAGVAAAALDAGATIVNDVSAGRADPGMLPLVASRQAMVVLMHMRGDPTSMQRDPRYEDVVSEVAEFLSRRVEAAVGFGIGLDRIIADPGIGFGKTLRHNLSLMANLRWLVDAVSVPVLVGTSRKSFLGALTGKTVEFREDATLATAVWALDQGAAIVRVHNVRPAAEALRLLRGMAGTSVRGS
ncbi:MAG: dihydropteroate synthase [Acidimicrobiia bacterium]